MMVTDGEQESRGAAREPRASAISFVTTEHFTLQGARSSTIAESTGRASMFLASAGGVVALAVLFGLMKYQRGVWERAAEEPITIDDVPDA